MLGFPLAVGHAGTGRLVLLAFAVPFRQAFYFTLSLRNVAKGEAMPEWLRIDAGTHVLRGRTTGRGARHVLCLHGLVDSLEIWDRVVPGLGKRAAITRYDQRGHGDSDAPPGPYTRTDLARDAIAVLDAVGVKESVLLGHSMGGVVAMEAALRFPDRVSGLILIGTTCECKPKVADWYERIAVAGEREGLDGLRRAIYGERSTKNIVGDPQGIADVTRMLESLAHDPLTPRLGEIDCPVLLLVGEKDPMGVRASEIVFDALPLGIARLERIAERGHWLQIDSHEAVIRIVEDWLEGERT